MDSRKSKIISELIFMCFKVWMWVNPEYELVQWWLSYVVVKFETHMLSWKSCLKFWFNEDRQQKEDPFIKWKA